jgi:hypothetical protein
MWPSGSILQPYANAAFIPLVRDYEFGYSLLTGEGGRGWAWGYILKTARKLWTDDRQED